MQSVIWLVDTLLSLYFWVLILHVVMTWLAAFNVVNTNQAIVSQVGRFLWQVTDPVLAPIRQFLRRLFGDLGGIDVSPVIALVVVAFLRRMLGEMEAAVR